MPIQDRIAEKRWEVDPEAADRLPDEDEPPADAGFSLRRRWVIALAVLITVALILQLLGPVIFS